MSITVMVVERFHVSSVATVATLQIAAQIKTRVLPGETLEIPPNRESEETHAINVDRQATLRMPVRIKSLLFRTVVLGATLPRWVGATIHDINAVKTVTTFLTPFHQ
jgi:hypothetical protein